MLNVCRNPSSESPTRASSPFTWSVRLLWCAVALLTASRAQPALAARAKGQPAAASKAGHEVAVARIVAVVDRDIVTAYELEQKAAGHLESLLETPAGPARDAERTAILRRVLDAEINERLLTHEVAANKDKLGVAEKDVDRAVEEVLSINRIGRDQLQAALYGQGLTMAAYRDKLRAQIERARLMQFKVQGRVHIKDNEVRRRCLERQRMGSQNVAVCAGHVLLQVPKDAAPARRAALQHEAEKIRDKLRAGASLATLAEQYSDDTTARDGSLGCFHRGEMVQAFEDAAFALPEGGVSDVVTTSFGLHVIKVFERRSAAAGGCDSEQQLEETKNELFQQEMARQMEVWLGELRAATFVDVRL